jgi:hypothetical protein
VTAAPTPIPIPQTEELFYVCLQALGDFEEAVPYRHVDDRVIEKLDIAFTDSDREARLRERLGFARSALKKVGAADNRQRGYWEITERGRELLGVPESEGERELTTAIHASYADRTADPGFLDEAHRMAESGEPVRLSPRELIEQWNVSRRGAAINQQIHDDLATVGLRTVPDFSTTWIDGEVVLFSIDGDPGTAPEPSASRAWDDDVSLSVGSLEPANRGVESVRPDDTLLQAQSLMMRYDYSQLAVLSGPHTVRGAITWESIGRRRLLNPGVDTVGDCIVEARIVAADHHLLDVVPDVAGRGFVFVRAVDNTPLGHHHDGGSQHPVRRTRQPVRLDW